MVNWPQALAGALTGLLVGLTGVGGGSLMTPLLVLLFGVAPVSAVGTDLWFAAITKLVAARSHQGHRLIDWEILKRLWPGSLSASALTLWWLKGRTTDPATARVLTTALALTLVVTAVAMLFQRRLRIMGGRMRASDMERFQLLQGPLTLLSGALLGVLVTLTSVGAGAIGTVLLTYIYPLRLTPPRLVATDIAHAVPLVVFAGIGHLVIGDVKLGLLGNLLLGSIPGVIVGTALTRRLPHQLLRGILAAILMIIGLRILWH